MRAIQALCEEHRALREVLDALELVLDCQRCDDCLDTEFALDVIEWLERFADGLHQDREELGLFPRLERRSPEEAQKVLSGLVLWHGHERERLGQMRERIEGAAYGDPWSRDVFTVAARAYIALQRQHMDLEDAQILPLARKVLTPEDDALVLAVYEHLERRHLQAGERSPIERANRLSASAARKVLDRQPSLLSAPAEVQRGSRSEGVTVVRLP